MLEKYKILSSVMCFALLGSCSTFEQEKKAYDLKHDNELIVHVKDTSTDIITLTITDPTGTVSSLTVPVGDFIF